VPDCGHPFYDGAKLRRPYSGMSKQAEQEVLWHLKDRSFSRLVRKLGLSYRRLRRLVEGEPDEDTIASIREEAQIFLGIDELRSKRGVPGCLVTEARKEEVLCILRDDKMAIIRNFPTKIRFHCKC